MATGDDAQRERPPFVKTAMTGTTGAMRVRAGGVGKGGSAASASTKPAAFTFNMKKPASTTSKAPTASAGIKFPGAIMSGPGGGALRVPVFGKKAASATVPTITKAPFAKAMGANGAPGEARAAIALKPQPSSGVLRFGSLSAPKIGGGKPGKKAMVPESKPEQKPNAAPVEKAVMPGTALKANVNGGKTGPPATFGRVKVPPTKESARSQVQQNGVTMNANKSSRFQFKSTRNVDKASAAVSSKTTTSATNGSRFQFKSSHNVQKTSPPIASNTLRVPAPTSAPVVSALDAGTASKKRIQPQPAQNMSTPMKKLRLENSGSAVPKTLQELNVVSPEPRGPARTPIARADMSGVATNDIAQGDASNVPTRQTALDTSVLTDPNSPYEHRGLVSNVLASLTHGVFMTAEEEQLANFTVDSGVLEVESESFLKRIRNLQLFMDDVGEQNLLSCNELLDTNAIASECLLDMMTDVTAIRGGVTLMELDELSSKVQQDLDSQGPSSTGIAFPW